MNTNQQSVLPDMQTAYNNLKLGVEQRVIFNKCAAAGYAPRNQAQATWLLDTVEKLAAIEEETGGTQAKQGGDMNDPFYRANVALTNLMQQHGLGGSLKQAEAVEADQAQQQAAALLAQDPTLYNSVLAMKVAEAEELKAYQAQMRQQQAA